MASKESLDKAHKFYAGLVPSLNFIGISDKVNAIKALADLLDEAIREARIAEHVELCSSCVGYRIKSGTGNSFPCARLAQLREGKT